ncbi:MAG: exopolysaccharide biosynthesis polyprenyl glycosylphosphotransferase [Oscillospiraceae bacterium]|nr:exopolysaccharide biosynthesis polyprenyl glycosylphosphotransferase [Oscillospiraceae bacterium]
MKNREQYKKLLSLIASLIILCLQTGIFIFVWYHCYSESGSNYFVRGNYFIIAQYMLMIFFFYKIYGGFRIGFLRMFEVVYSQVLSVICVNVMTYFQLCLIGRWEIMTHVTPILVMTVVDIVVALLWAFFSRWVYVKLYPPRKLLLVYGPYSPDNLIKKMSAREDKYEIEEAISIEQDIEEIEEKISQYANVILTDIPADLRNRLLKYCFKHNIRCYCVPKISDIMIMSSENIHLFDTSLLVFRNMGLTAEQRFAKRAFDLVLSLVLSILTAPIMLIIAACIKFYDGGPVFFAQDRLTKDGKVFKVIKFRSMKVQQENAQYTLTRKDDDRVTPVGKVLRAIHFDELPQMYNILMGDMSFVGPRPECPKLAAEYSEIVPQFDYRLKVKAGLTGYAQVYGKYNTTPYDKLKLDLTYITKYSFLLDLKLIMLTVKILFQKENTEGIESWQTSAATRDNLEKLNQK